METASSESRQAHIKWTEHAGEFPLVVGEKICDQRVSLDCFLIRASRVGTDRRGVDNLHRAATILEEAFDLKTEQDSGEGTSTMAEQRD